MVPGGETATHFYWSLSKSHELAYKKTIRNSAELTAEERTGLTEKVIGLISKYKGNLESTDRKQLRKLALNSRVEKADLNSDGNPEFILQANDYEAGCGATGNCAFWVLDKTAQGYRLLLDTRDKQGIGGAERITIKDEQHKGYKDIVLAAHDSASEKSLIVERFDGKMYREVACYIANWESWDGELHSLKNPDIFPCPAAPQ